MRLNRLHLTRYGHFTDFSLDFGEKKPDVPDFHLIYGPNEAGKSTAFSAYLDLLYGMARTSKYDFRHGAGAMQVAADIEFGDGVRHFKRQKKTRDSLLDGSGAPVPEQAILADLGGVGREQYQLMFLLDDESLERGGDSILQSESDLGRLLFSATSGLADISQRLAGLRAESDAIHRRRASTTAIAEARKAIGDLDRKIRELDTSGAAFANLVEARDKADRQYRTVLAEQSHARTARDLAQRQGRALSFLADLQRLRGPDSHRTSCGAVTEALADRVTALRERRVAVETGSGESIAEIARLEADRDRFRPDAGALSVAEGYEALHGLRSRFTASREDIPRRRMMHDAAVAELGAIAARVGLPPGTEPESLPFGASLTGALRELIAGRSKLDTERDLAGREADRAALEHAQAVAEVSSLPGMVLNEASAPALAAALDALQSSDVVDRLRSLRRDAGRGEARLAGAMEALSPWRGDEAALRALLLPEEETLQQMKRNLEQATSARDSAVRELNDLTRTRDEAFAQAQALAEDTGLYSDAQRTEIRQARDDAWARHRSVLAGATAEVFEAAMRLDDAAGARQLAGARSAARLAGLRQDVAVKDALLVPANARLAAAATALRQVEAALAALIAGLWPAFPAGFGLPEVSRWLQRCRTARDSLADLDGLRIELSEAERSERDATARLAGALAKAGLDAPAGTALDGLMQVARAALAARETARQSRLALETRAADLERRQKAVRDVDERLTRWAKAWDEAVSQCWLGRLPHQPMPGEVEEILKALEPVAGHLATVQASRQRIEAMEKDEAEFRGGVAAIARSLGVDPDVYDTGRLDRILHDRISEALAARQRRKDADNRLEEAIARGKEHAQRRASFETEREAVLGALSAADLGDAEAMVEAYRQRVTQERHARDLEDKLLGELRLTDMTAALGQLEGLDSAQLDAAILALDAQLKDHDTAVPSAFAALSDARRQLDAVGGDDAVARLQALRRTKRLEIEAHARRYLALQAGALAAERAIRQFRDEHRSGMLQNASEAFRTVSCGAYTGLATQPGRDGDVLVALSEGGAYKLAAELSKGTRFQLYLALRIAGYREFARMHPPVPFVADDILETFDNDRTCETLRLLSGLAHVGQVICFTHHRHVCDLAHQVTPWVQMHDLGPARR